MFTVQEILDIAIRLENNGEATYRNAQRYINDTELKTLLNWIAKEEQNHANWFGNLKTHLTRDADHHLKTQLSRALVEDVVQGQVFSLQTVDFDVIDTPEKMIRTFIGFEEDTIAFYEILKALIDDTPAAIQLEQIIAEEKKHIVQLREKLSPL